MDDGDPRRLSHRVRVEHPGADFFWLGHDKLLEGSRGDRARYRVRVSATKLASRGAVVCFCEKEEKSDGIPGGLVVVGMDV
jgi:hypothetical protein